MCKKLNDGRQMCDELANYIKQRLSLSSSPFPYIRLHAHSSSTILRAEIEVAYGKSLVNLAKTTAQVAEIGCESIQRQPETVLLFHFYLLAFFSVLLCNLLDFALQDFATIALKLVILIFDFNSF